MGSPRPHLLLTPMAAREKLAAGVPLLADEALDFYTSALRRFLVALCSWVANQPARKEIGERLERGVESGLMDVDALLVAALADDATALEESARNLAAPATLMGVARELAPLLVALDSSWSEATCPIGGGVPLLAEHWGADSIAP